jgi:hypothetical protein
MSLLEDNFHRRRFVCHGWQMILPVEFIGQSF